MGSDADDFLLRCTLVGNGQSRNFCAWADRLKLEVTADIAGNLLPAQKFSGRYLRRDRENFGHAAEVRNRYVLTRSGTSQPPITALRKLHSLEMHLSKSDSHLEVYGAHVANC